MNNLRDVFDAFVQEVDLPWMMSNVEKLWKIEFGQCFRDHNRSSRHVEKLLKKSQFDQVERISFPADGKTGFQDKTMPMAWDASVGRLTVKKSSLPFDEPVVADYQRHPFHLIRGSVSTPKGGVVTRLVSEEQMYGGHDVRGAMVITAPETRPGSAFARAACDMGALGSVSDFSPYRYDYPDSLAWFNAATEGTHWHVHDEDRPFVSFGVSPRVGNQLRAAVRGGEVHVHVESNGRRYKGEIDLVTGVVPGRNSRELWLLSHLYEPLSNDNSTGCIAAIEIGRTLQRLIASGRLPRPRFTLRVVLGMEMYGFAAYAHHRGGNLKDKVIGAVNMDAVCSGPNSGGIVLAPAGTPFFGDYLMKDLFRACQNEPDYSPKSINEHGSYGDDMFLSDPTVGLPTVWPHGKSGLWHNSEQRMNMVHPEPYRKATAFNGAWVTGMLMLQGDFLDAQLRNATAFATEHLEKEAAEILRKVAEAAPEEQPALAPQLAKGMTWRRKWEEGRMAAIANLDKRPTTRKALTTVEAAGRRVEAKLKRDIRAMVGARKRSVKSTESAWERIAATIIPQRATVGFPNDLLGVPREKRRRLPGSITYGPFSRVMANMDGKKTLQELIQEAAWESGEVFDSATIRDYIGTVEFLTEHGYLKTDYRKTVRQSDIVSALRRAGLSTGDLAFVHGGLVPLGHVDGGADAVIDACLKVLGPDGTLLMPTFTHSLTSVASNTTLCGAFRPYNPKKSRPWVGRISTDFLERKGVLRSAHPTHSVAGIGPLADACLRDHQENDAPCCRRSPFGQMVDRNGKIIWIGADLHTTTLFHLLEDELQLPYLANVPCCVERADGTPAIVCVPRFPTGHRDFYERPGENSKMYTRLQENGLSVRRKRLGFDEVKLIDAKSLYELGMAALKDDPNLLLCDSPDCLFCSEQKSPRKRGSRK